MYRIWPHLDTYPKDNGEDVDVLVQREATSQRSGQERILPTTMMPPRGLEMPSPARFAYTKRKVRAFYSAPYL